MHDLNALRQLYGERAIRPGDTVRVEGWSQPFGVLDIRNGRFLVESENGTRMVARADLVHLDVDSEEARANA